MKQTKIVNDGIFHKNRTYFAQQKKSSLFENGLLRVFCNSLSTWRLRRHGQSKVAKLPLSFVGGQQEH